LLAASVRSGAYLTGAGASASADFTFDAEADRYTCLAGKELVQFRRAYATPRTGIDVDGARHHGAGKKDCDVCGVKAQCRPNADARKIPQDVDEDARDVALALAKTPEFEVACRRRKKVEMLFAPRKRNRSSRPLS
jgi:hypothetical protein